MTKKPDTASAQPYHNLDPARAAAKLGPMVDTTRFAKAAAFCSKGREDLARLFSGWQKASPAVLDLGNHQVSDPGRAGPPATGAARAS